MDATGRRSIGQMPYRRRQDGFSAQERRDERLLWENILRITTATIQLPAGVIKIAFLMLIRVLITIAGNIIDICSDTSSKY